MSRNATRLLRSLLLCTIVISLSGLTPRVAAQPGCGSWTRLDDFASPRFFRISGLMYDAARSETIVVHWPDGHTSSEIWSWNGDRWTLVDQSGPADIGAATYDSERDVIVLFVQGDDDDGPGETWEWDHVTWRLVSESGPASRVLQRMVFDVERGVTVLFGGYDARYLGDTWTWDGETWTQVADSGPSPRWAHDLAYDSERGVIVLFGGFTLSGRVGDTWEWNGSQWNPIANEGPSPRGLHALSYDRDLGVTVLYGGSSPSEEQDTWHWNGIEWTLVTTEGPGGSTSHRMTFDVARSHHVLIGGELGVDTWLWDGVAWSVLVPDQPAPGTHEMVWNSDDGIGVMFESHTGSGGSARKTWLTDGSTWTLASIDGPEFAGPMAYDSARRLVVMCNYLGETWAWDGAAWSMVSVAGPAGISAMTYDRHRRVVVAFGPFNLGRGETWEWDGVSWSRRSTNGPRFRTETAMVYDPVRRVTTMFGGVHHTSEDSVYYNDTWEWNGATWRQAAVSGPSPRANHMMVVDVASGLTLLFGGNIAREMNGEVWAWDGQLWRPAMYASGPEPRTNGAMVYDASSHRTLLFGGRDDNFSYGDLWELDVAGATPELVVESSCPSTGPGSLSWTCATPGGRVLIAYAENPGSVVVPPPLPCAGIRLGLELSSVRFVGSAFSDAFGRRTLTGFVPAESCGGFMQFVDVERCTVSNVVTID